MIVSVGGNVVNAPGNVGAGPLMIPWGQNYYQFCDASCGTISVPEGYEVVYQADESALPTPVPYGPADLRIRKSDSSHSRVADFSAYFAAGGSACEFLNTAQTDQKSLLHGFSTYRHTNGSYALYIPKIPAHTTLRVCSGKLDIGCTSSDDWSFAANEAGTITATHGGFSTSGITVTVADGYWKVSGLTGTSAQGEGTAAPTLYRITNLPTTVTATYAVRSTADNTDVYTTGLPSGSYTVRLTMDGTVVADASVGLTQDRNWSAVTAQTDPINHKVVVKYPGTADGVSGTHTIYAAKGGTTSFRVCPGAQVLSDVSASCTNGVVFSGAYPETKSVGGDTVVVGTTSIGGMTYWYASGLSGSGGEGEGTGGDPVPFFPWWGLPALALICGTYVMRRETALE